jgi:hypothetical protein
MILGDMWGLSSRRARERGDRPCCSRRAGDTWGSGECRGCMMRGVRGDARGDDEPRGCYVPFFLFFVCLAYTPIPPRAAASIASQDYPRGERIRMRYAVAKRRGRLDPDVGAIPAGNGAGNRLRLHFYREQ